MGDARTKRKLWEISRAPAGVPVRARRGGKERNDKRPVKSTIPSPLYRPPAMHGGRIDTHAVSSICATVQLLFCYLLSFSHIEKSPFIQIFKQRIDVQMTENF